MHTPIDPKIMAKRLRAALAERGIALTHGECLDVIARQHGLADWNMLSAQRARPAADPDPVPDAALPAGWRRTGRGHLHYAVALEPHSGPAVRIDGPALADGQDRFCTLMQSVRADALEGGRIRLSAWLKGRDVEGSGTIWLRVDDSARQVLAFDNMEQRPGGALAGTWDWTRRDIVLDVPEHAASIHYGFFLNGSGTCWARGFAIEPVDPAHIPATGHQPGLLPRPTNLDFRAPPP